jgi:metal-sulfur cluster biosynthetic enzyme
VDGLEGRDGAGDARPRAGLTRREERINMSEQAGQAAGTGTNAPDTEDVLEALRDVVDPELGVNVVDLGLVYGVTLGGDGVATIDMTLTSAACPLTDVIEDQAAAALEGIVPDFRINWVWLPPWGPDKITEDGREQLRALGFNV